MIYKRGTAFSIVLIFTALSILGWFLISFLPLSLQAEQKTNYLQVTASWPHTSPLQQENELTSKLESIISNLEGVKNLESISKNGLSQISIEINKYYNIDKFRLQLSSAIRRIFPSLPQGVSYPHISYQKTDTEYDKPLIIYSLRSEENTHLLQQYAERHIKPELALTTGIDHTEVYGGTAYEYLISYNTNMMNHLGITTQDISSAIKRFFKRQNIGWAQEQESVLIDSVNHHISVRFALNKTSASVWEEIPIQKIENQIILLGQLANVSKSQQKPDAYYRINGENAINIVVYRKSGSNAIKLTKLIEQQIAHIKKHLPNNYKLQATYKSTNYIEKELLTIFQRTILTILILVLFVAIVSNSWKYVLIIVLSLTTNISLAFVLYYSFQVQIHLYSLAGITVSLGLIIDNAIVMTDHLLYQKNLKIYTALLASTFTTAASLIVIWFLPAEIKLNLWDFSLIITINLLVSLLVSLFYTPALFSLLLIRKKSEIISNNRKHLIIKLNKIYYHLLIILLKYKKTVITLLIIAFGIPIFLLPSNIEKEGLLAQIYNQTLGSDWYVDNLKSPLDKYLGGSLRLFNYYVFESSYYQKQEDTKLYIRASLPKGASMEQLNRIIIEMENYLLQYDEQITFYTKVDNPQYALITIRFKEGTPSMLPYLLKGKIVSHSLNLGGISWNVYGIGKGFSQTVGLSENISFKVALTGYSLSKLEEYAQNLRGKLETNPRVTDINTSANKRWWHGVQSYEYIGEFQTDLIISAHTNIYNLLKDLKQQTVNYHDYFQVFFNGKSERVHLISNDILQKDKWSLLHSPNKGNKLNNYLNIKKIREEESIFKENQSYIKLVDFKYIGSRSIGQSFLLDIIETMSNQLPMGYKIRSLNMLWNKQKESTSYFLAILLIIVLIYFICSILFESLTWPLAIILMIPFSFIGIFITFYYFDFNFDQGGYASFVLVSGLVVNASIYLLNEFSRFQKDSIYNKNLLSIYIKAFNRKIVPILLTVLSTIFGLLPFVIMGQHEAFWFALAVGTMGGLLFSIIILILVFPLFILKNKLID